MGVLEDAIREHLDLKRRHGATDEELTRQETEALGPTRRDAPEGAEPEAEHPSAVEEPAASEPPVAVDEPELPEVEPEPEPEPPAPADEDTVMYAPGEAPDAPEHDEDPDFGSEPPERRPQGDLDFD